MLFALGRRRGMMEKMEENYKQEAIEMLRQKRYWCAAADALREQIRLLDAELNACRTASEDEAGSKDGGGAARERVLRLNGRKEAFCHRLRMMEGELEQIQRAYATLSPYQRDLLDTFFVSGQKNCAERLARRYYKERSSLYRDRKKAIDAFALALFGSIPC